MNIRKRKEKEMRIHSFRGKVIWITGASSGIGEALACALAERGAKLILSSRNKEALARVKKNCTKGLSEIHILSLDLSKLKTLKRKAEKALRMFGRIDLMIHNAGVAARDLAANTDIEVDKKIMDVNYFGPIALTKYILRSMLEQKSGHFVVNSSISGKFGVPKLSSYCASKHALHGFFDSLRSEIADSGIKVTMAVPGFVRTDITVNAMRGDGTKYNKMMRVQERGIAPSDCARQILEAVAKNKEEIVLGGPEILSVYCKRFFPRLFSRIIRNHPVAKLNSFIDFFKIKRPSPKLEY